MSKNKLYNFINDIISNDIISKEFTIPGVKKLEHHTHKEGKKYFLFRLPVKKETVIGTYTLLQHHLSVYEEGITDLDQKSQYHYTASFSDHFNNYQLHVYFDSHDKCVGKPFFSVLNKNSEPLSVTQEHLQETANMLAHRSIHQLVKYLREAQAKTIITIQNQLDVLEEETIELSKNFNKNKITYLSTLDKQIAHLEKLGSYSKGRDIKALIFLLQNIKKHIAQNSGITDIKEEKSYINDQSLSTPKEEISSNKTTTVQNKNTKKEINLNTKNIGLKDILQKASQLSLDQLLEALKTCSYLILELQVDDSFSDAPLKDLHDFRTLKLALDKLGLNTLKQLLAKGDFEKTKPLHLFYPLLSRNDLHYALLMNNSHLIDFLLMHEIVNVDYKHFKIKEIFYDSITDYYFKRTSVTTETLASFDVFIKRGLSLLTIDNQTGLPFAALLLLDPNHPLRPILDKNAETTILNPMFYKKLNYILHGLHKLPDCFEGKKILIKHLIHSNQMKISRLTTLSSSSQTRTLNQINYQLESDIRKKIGTQLFEKVSTDDKIKELYAEIYTQEKTLWNMLTKLEQARVVKLSKKALDFNEEVLNALPLRELQASFENIFEGIKTASIEQLKEILHFYNLFEKLLENKKNLNTARGKDWKSLCEYQKVIDDEMKNSDKKICQEVRTIVIRKKINEKTVQHSYRVKLFQPVLNKEDEKNNVTKKDNNYSISSSK